jgi:hypothetical protein
MSVTLIVTGYYYLTKYTFLGILTKTSFSNIVHPAVDVDLRYFYYFGNLYELCDIVFNIHGG